MDMILVRSLMTLLAAISFAGIYWWAFSAYKKSDFDEAAKLPFVDDANPSHRKGQQL